MPSSSSLRVPQAATPTAASHKDLMSPVHKVGKAPSGPGEGRSPMAASSRRRVRTQAPAAAAASVVAASAAAAAAQMEGLSLSPVVKASTASAASLLDGASAASPRWNYTQYSDLPSPESSSASPSSLESPLLAATLRKQSPVKAQAHPGTAQAVAVGQGASVSPPALLGSLSEDGDKLSPLGFGGGLGGGLHLMESFSGGLADLAPLGPMGGSLGSLGSLGGSLDSLGALDELVEDWAGGASPEGSPLSDPTWATAALIAGSASPHRSADPFRAPFVDGASPYADGAPTGGAVAAADPFGAAIGAAYGAAPHARGAVSVPVSVSAVGSAVGSAVPLAVNVAPSPAPPLLSPDTEPDGTDGDGYDTMSSDESI